MTTFFICICLISCLGFFVTLGLFYAYKWAYEKERHLHTETLLECRSMYEEMSRHLKRNGLGELPIPELLERETIKRLNDETNLFIDPSFRIISRMQGRKS